MERRRKEKVKITRKHVTYEVEEKGHNGKERKKNIIS